MKLKFFITVILMSFFFISCDNEKYELVDVYSAEYISFDEFRASSVAILPPEEIESSGKIYVYNNFIFVNDVEKGIHIIDNSHPDNPVKIAFIQIKGNVDLEIKNNYLYADSYMDLVVFDISDFENINVVSRLENVFPNSFGFGYGYSDQGIITGYNITQEYRKVEEQYYYDDIVAFSESSNIGQGGSLARFKIVENYLYAVDDSSINVFDINNLTSPIELEDVYVNFGIETIFNKGNRLFLGSTNGLYIYDITTPASPTYISEFLHVTSCDPVVVDETYAYVTLRGGNNCGATESVLEIIDITDDSNPILKERYPMDNPYGLGIKDDLLFICDGSSGLKVYNKNKIESLELLNTFTNTSAFDVVPTADSLIMIGDNTIYQYSYNTNGIQFISEFSLQ